MELKQILEGLSAAEAALRAAQAEEAEGTVTAISYASLTWEVEPLTKTVIIKTQNRFFAGDGYEVRRGRIGEGFIWDQWTIIWEREVGVTTGEDFMNPQLRTWLLWLTAEDDYHSDEEYWEDRYPW